MASFGVRDKFTNNVDTIISLVEENEDEGGFHIWAGGHYEDIFDGALTREQIAAKPVKCVLSDSQRHLSIGYDLTAGHLILKLQGVATDKLPAAKKIQGICQSKTVNTNTTDQR